MYLNPKWYYVLISPGDWTFECGDNWQIVEFASEHLAKGFFAENEDRPDVKIHLISGAKLLERMIMPG